MGVAIRDLIEGKEVSFEELSGKDVAIDSHNMLYQFLTTIRSQDGSLLKDSHGNTTSHLTGLFSRTSNMMQKGIRPIFVFDGKMPDLKKKEIERRVKIKEEAALKFEAAKESEDVDEMKKYASRTSRLTKDMVIESKELISALGLPIIEAPMECDAQISFLVNNNHAYAAVSQDYDCLLHGCKLLVRNLSVSGKRKIPGKIAYSTVAPEIISLNEILNLLNITREQLICLGMLIGTDYNPGGIKGIGPKNALKIVQEQKDPEKIFATARWQENFDFSWQEVYGLFLGMEVKKDIAISSKPVDKDKVYDILVSKHDFSSSRVKETLSKIDSSTEKKKQKGLGDFF